MTKILLDKVFPNPEQPRQNFDSEQLTELANSLRQHNLINAIAVEGPIGDAGIYILIDGERRTRAARLAGWTEIDATVREPGSDSNPQKRLEMALVANMQRSDLDPVEEAQSIAIMHREYGQSINRIAASLGHCGEWVNSRLHLLDLPEEILPLVRSRQIPCDIRVTAALMSLPADIRVETSLRLAKAGVGIRAIMKTCEKLNETIGSQEKKTTNFGHASIRQWNMTALIPNWPTGWVNLRKMAGQTCEACSLNDQASEIVCGECPGVELLRRIVKQGGLHGV